MRRAIAATLLRSFGVCPMIVTMVQYRLRCDSDGCGRSTGCRTDVNSVECEAVRVGWELCDQTASGDRLYRCPACVRTRAYPAGWGCSRERIGQEGGGVRPPAA